VILLVDIYIKPIHFYTDFVIHGLSDFNTR